MTAPLDMEAIKRRAEAWSGVEGISPLAWQNAIDDRRDLIAEVERLSGAWVPSCENVERLFEHMAHGDEKHRQWLREHLNLFFEQAASSEPAK